MPSPDMSPELRAFLTEWLAWAEADAPEHEVFSGHTGLCNNVCWWTEENLQSTSFWLLRELEERLGDPSFPFGRAEYTRARRAGLQHRDPNRLAWVRTQLGES